MSDENNNDASEYGGRYSGFDRDSEYSKWNPDRSNWSSTDSTVNLPNIPGLPAVGEKPNMSGNVAQDAARMLGLGPINGSLNRDQVRALQEAGFGGAYGGNLNNLQGQTVDHLANVFSFGDTAESLFKGIPGVKTMFSLPQLFSSFFDKQENTTPKAVANTLSSMWGPTAAVGHLMKGDYAGAAGAINPLAGVAVNAFQNGPTQQVASQLGGLAGGVAGQQLGYQSGSLLGNLLGGRVGQAIGSNVATRGFNSLQGKSLSGMFK